MRAAVWAALVAYLAVVLYLTLYSREATVPRKILEPFWEYRMMQYAPKRQFWIEQIVSNVLLLLPLGALLRCLTRRVHVLLTGGIAMLFSCWIELTQYVTARGLLEVDDVMHNTLGAVIGCLLMEGLLRIVGAVRARSTHPRER